MAFRPRQRHNPVPSGRRAWHHIGGSYQSAMGHRRPQPGLPLTWPACWLRSIQVSVSHPIGFGCASSSSAGPSRLQRVGARWFGGKKEAAGLFDLPAWVVGWHFGPLIRLEPLPSVEPISDGPRRPVPSPQSVSVFPYSHLCCPGVVPRSPPVDGLSRRRIRAAGLALPLNHTVGVPNDALWLLHLATAGCGRRWASQERRRDASSRVAGRAQRLSLRLTGPIEPAQ